MGIRQSSGIKKEDWIQLISYKSINEIDDALSTQIKSKAITKKLIEEIDDTELKAILHNYKDGASLFLMATIEKLYLLSGNNHFNKGDAGTTEIYLSFLTKF